MCSTPATPSVPDRSGPTLAEVGATLVIGVAIFVMLAIVFAPVTTVSREAPRRSQCRNNLKQIGLALLDYHDQYGTFPPPFTVDAHGKRLHSWRTLILPYVDQAPLYKRIDFSRAWNDPINAEAAKATPLVYHCPGMAGDVTRTSYLAVVSPEGAFQPGKSTTLKDIADGSSQTLLVLETTASRCVHWMEPTDLDETGLQALATEASTTHARGMHGLAADGSVRFFSNDELTKFGRAWLTIAGKDAVE